MIDFHHKLELRSYLEDEDINVVGVLKMVKYLVEAAVGALIRFATFPFSSQCLLNVFQEQGVVSKDIIFSFVKGQFCLMYLGHVLCRCCHF